jgi:hypothetical protein
MSDRHTEKLARLEDRLQLVRDILERVSDPAFNSFGDKLDAVLRAELGTDEDAEDGEITEALTSRILAEYDTLREPLASLTGLSTDAIGSAGSLLSRVISGGVALAIQSSHKRPDRLQRRIAKLEAEIAETKAAAKASDKPPKKPKKPADA